MAPLNSFDVTLVTGTHGTNQSVYVNLCGREFLLDTAGNNFAPGKEERFIFGQGGNVLNADRNDPRSRLPLDGDDVDAFPVYLRLGGNNNWSVRSARVTAQAGTRFVAFKRDCAAPGLVLSAASGQRLFLKKDDDFTGATFQGNAVVRIFGIELTKQDPDVVAVTFQGRLEFRQNRTVVTGFFNDITGTVGGIVTITGKQNGASTGTFNPATGRMDLTLPLRAILPFVPGVLLGVDSDITFPMTTETIGELSGSRHNPATGDMRLVGSAVFQNGDLSGKTAHLILTGRLNPPV